MKKIALFCAGLMLSSASAFAFDNASAGYTINNKTPDFVMQSSKLYGYMNLKEEALHVVSHFDAKDVSEAIGVKFTTAYFEKTCSDLSVLKANEAYKAASKLPLLNLENYAKLDAGCKQLFDNSLKGVENVLQNVKVVNIGGKKAISMFVYMKQNDEVYNTYVTLTSANNMLYILASGGPLAEVPQAEEAAKDTKKTTKKAEKKEALGDALKDIELVDVKTLNPKAVAKSASNHNKFVKLFKTVPPVKNAAAAVSFTDAVAKRTINLPANWSYGQYNLQDKEKPGVITVAMPADTLSKVSEKLAPEISNKDKLKNLNESAVLAKLGEVALAEVKDIVVTGTYNMAYNKEVADALANPGATKLQLDVMFHSGLKELKKLSGPYMKLNSYKFNNHIDKNVGVITVNADITALRKVDFLTRVKLLGTPQIAMAALQIHNKKAPVDKVAAELYERWQF